MEVNPDRKRFWGLTKKRMLKWNFKTQLENGVEYVQVEEADAVVNRLIELGDAMSLEMMTAMLQGYIEPRFVSAHDQYQKFVYSEGFVKAPSPKTLPPFSIKKKSTNPINVSKGIPTQNNRNRPPKAVSRRIDKKT